MRRLIVTTTVVAMIAALLPFTGLMSAAQAAGPAPTIAPPDGKTAVRASDAVSVTGEAPGLADGPVNATLIGLRPDGTEMFRAGGVPGVQVSGGQFQGEVVLGCGFGAPGPGRCNPPNPDDGFIAAVTVKLPGAARSNTLRVDYTKPEIVRYELVGPQTVRVVFSEPVRAPDGDNPADWDVDHDRSDATPPVRPLTVSDPKDDGCAYHEPEMSTGCTRLLELPAVARQTEDATPFTRYLPDILSGQSAVYQDYADNDLRYVPAVESSEALDRIRPAAPNIATIDGKTGTGGEFISNSSAPVVRVNNLLGGHTVRLRVTRDGGATQVLSQEVPVGVNTVDMTLPALPADAGYTVRSIAIDAAGNRSNDDSKTGPAERADGAVPTAIYTLDRRAPAVLAATLIDTTTVSVEFTEAIFPDGNAGDWSVGGIPVTASGSGATRTLKAQTRLANSGLLRWRPNSPEPGSNGRYGDLAGNGMLGMSGLELNDLPPLSAPQISRPATATFTTGDSVVIRGTADSRPNLVAELFDRGSETVKAGPVDVSNGRWAFNQALEEDGRFSFEVRIRDTKTGIVSQRNRVPDVVRDTTDPVVEVSKPAEVGPLDDPPSYGVGDALTVTWNATDTADDAKVPDHSRIARVILVSESGTRRDVSGPLAAQPGRDQSHTFRLTGSDLEGRGAMDLHFEVVVDDLASNVGSAISGDITLLQSLIGFTPVLNAQAPGGSGSMIEVRFPVAMDGSTVPLDWSVDGSTPMAAQLSDDRRTVTLTVPFLSDPNARPEVTYTPTPLSQRLQTANGRQVTLNPRTTLDRIVPALSVTVPDTPPVIDANRVVFSGETDTTASPNLIAAYRARANGDRYGSPVATRRAGTDGAWRLVVPLEPNRLNRFVVQAIDPSANRSATLPSSPYRVKEDSVTPVVRVQSPRRGTTVRQTMTIRWSTVEAHRSHARLLYRVRGGEWKTITNRTSDDGHFRWTAPKSLHADVFDLRVQAFDRTGKHSTTAVTGLLGDFVRPVVRYVRAVGPYRLVLQYSEPVHMPRFGFTVDGIGASRVIHQGARNILVLKRSVNRTTPELRYKGTTTRDRAGNLLAAFQRTAARGFVLPVVGLGARRVTPTSVRLTWRDDRNRPAHLRSYRIFRNGRHVATVARSARAVRLPDPRGTTYTQYVVRAVDNEGRISQIRAVSIR